MIKLFYILTNMVYFNPSTPHQSGFRSGYSTQDVLLHVTDRWLRAIDEGKCTGAVFLDLAQGF